MKKKILGIFVCTLLIATAVLPVMGTIENGKITMVNNTTLNANIVDEEFTETEECRYDEEVFLNESFDGTFPPDGWSTDDFVQSDSNQAGGTSPEAKLCWTYITENYSYLKSKPIDTSDTSTLSLEFKSFIDDYMGEYTCTVLARADTSGPWTDVTPWFNPISGDVGPDTYSIEITCQIGPATEIMFEFDGPYWNFNYWYIDDVMLIGNRTGCLVINATFQPVQVVYQDDPKYGDDMDTSKPCMLKAGLDMVAGKNTYLFGYPYENRSWINITVCNNRFEFDASFVFTKNISGEEDIVINETKVVPIKMGTHVYSFKAPRPGKPFQWDVWAGNEQSKTGYIVLSMKPDNTLPCKGKICSPHKCLKVKLQVRVNKTHNLRVLFLPFTFEDGPAFPPDFTTEAGKKKFNDWIREELRPWWIGIYPVRERGVTPIYWNWNKIENISIWNKSQIPWRKVWVHDLASFQALNDSEKNQVWAKFGKLSVLAACYKDMYDRVVFWLPREVVNGSDGLAYPCEPNSNYRYGVMVSWTTWDGKPLRDCTPAHEIGHTYGLDDNYNWSRKYWGDPGIGYWVNIRGRDVLWDQATTRDLMGYTNALWGDKNKTWIKKPNYKDLLQRFTEYDDPEVLLISGFIDNKDNVELNPWYRMDEGHIDIEWGTTGDYIVRAYDNNKALLDETGFNVNFVLSEDYVGEMVVDYTIFAFRVEYLNDLHRIDIIKKSTGEILASRTRSLNSPQVTITKPSSGESIKPGLYEIKWTGTDLDGDDLFYNVYLSDDSDTWFPLDLEIEEESCTADFSTLQKGDYQLAVLVTDGWNTAEDIVDFSIKKARSRNILVNNPIWRLINQFPLLRLLLQRLGLQ